MECLDRYFGNVCELDLIFNFHKAARVVLEPWLEWGDGFVLSHVLNGTGSQLNLIGGVRFRRVRFRRVRPNNELGDFLALTKF